MSEELDPRVLVEKLSVATEVFVRNLAPRGIVPKFLSAVTRDRRHFLLDLKTLGMDRRDEMDFLRWLVSREDVCAHASTRAFEDVDALPGMEKRHLMVMVFSEKLGRELEMPFWPDAEGRLTYGETSTTDLSQELVGEHVFNYSRKSEANQLKRWSFGERWARLKERVVWRTM